MKGDTAEVTRLLGAGRTGQSLLKLGMPTNFEGQAISGQKVNKLVTELGRESFVRRLIFILEGAFDAFRILSKD
ncbi:hypothetical protein CL176_06405 [Suicoccus acidiformans]|uniref:Uncharacterized protein n=1 Tax=Suicoccus acidiformans TaxID=2036206 RepID=A0A347WKQ1_9LACT|nr:hypothetical protein CL176_06405 [Suicoccus acidiformans]